MSWHGSLTCSYCYERGHTRRKCPEMKRRHDEYKALLEDGKSDTASWGQRGAYREYQSQQEGLKESNKHCAYCQHSGHRVNTCPERMMAVSMLKELDDWFIPVALGVLSDLDLGKGTVLPYSGYVGNEYRNDIPVIITGISQPEVGGLSVINLFDPRWVTLSCTILATMSNTSVRPPQSFSIALYSKLYDMFDIKDWQFEYSYYSDENRESRNANPIIEALGSPPRIYNKEREDVTISGMAHPFDETNALFGFNYDKKREVNKLFREKDGLVDQRHSQRIVTLYHSLKERGVI